MLSMNRPGIPNVTPCSVPLGRGQSINCALSRWPTSGITTTGLLIGGRVRTQLRVIMSIARSIASTKDLFAGLG